MQHGWGQPHAPQRAPYQRQLRPRRAARIPYRRPGSARPPRSARRPSCHHKGSDLPCSAFRAASVFSKGKEVSPRATRGPPFRLEKSRNSVDDSLSSSTRQLWTLLFIRDVALIIAC
eukprot:scaffold23614_cov129-Isochrysis_galbana.AAC.1